MPIWRNQETFAPATVMVEITHESGRKPSPAAGSTFALPEYVDDESSSSDDDVEAVEESEEAEEYLHEAKIHAPSKLTIVDLTQGQREADIVDLTDKEVPRDMDHTANGLIDLTSPPRASSPDMEAEENEAELQVLHATARILDKIVNNPSDRDESDIRTPSSPESDDGDNSLNLTDDETDSTDSMPSMEDVGGNHSDDDEGSNSDDEIPDWDAEYSSDDDVLDEGESHPITTLPHSNPITNLLSVDDPDTAGWGPIEELFVPPVPFNRGLDATASDGNQDDTTPLGANNPRFDHPFAFAGPLPVPYFPVSDNAPVFAPTRVTLPSILNPEARQASPSDAALPKRSPNFPSVLPLGGSSTAEALGEKTGKYEYFAAREENRFRTFAPSNQSPTPLMSNGWVHSADCKSGVAGASIVAAKQSSAVEEATAAEKPTATEQPKIPEKHTAAEKDTDKASVVEKPSVTEKPASQQSEPPLKPTPAATPKSSSANQTVVITPLLESGDEFLNKPQDSIDLELPTYPGDEKDEPISAYELQKRKLAAQKQLPTKESKFADATRRTHVGISDIVDVSPGAEPESEKQAPAAAKGKRKADDMMELNEQEIQWEASESKLIRHLRAANKTMLRHAPANIDDLPASGVEALIDEVLGSRRSSKHVEPVSDERPPKRLRLRKIAERLGYAALGGATVGAALVSTLIYTAPTFT